MGTYSSLMGGSAGGDSLFGSLVTGSDSDLAGSAGGLLSSDDVVFSKADGSASVTLSGTVSLSGAFARLPEGGTTAESRPLARQLFKVTLSEDPGVSLGSPLVTNDKATWKGRILRVVGTAVSDGEGGFRVMIELVA